LSNSGACGTGGDDGQLKMNDRSVLATLYPVGFEFIKFCTRNTGTNTYFILTLPFFLLKHTTVGKSTAIFLDGHE